jgi:hypothetical protein
VISGEQGAQASDDFHSTDSSTVWLVDQNEVEHHIAATCLIWLGDEHLPKEVVARPVVNTGSSLLLNVPQELMAQLVGCR